MCRLPKISRTRFSCLHNVSSSKIDDVNWSHRCLISLKHYGLDKSVVPVHYIH